MVLRSQAPASSGSLVTRALPDAVEVSSQGAGLEFKSSSNSAPCWSAALMTPTSTPPPEVSFSVQTSVQALPESCFPKAAFPVSMQSHSGHPPPLYSRNTCLLISPVQHRELTSVPQTQRLSPPHSGMLPPPYAVSLHISGLQQRVR